MTQNKKQKILILANVNTGENISGGDTILVNLVEKFIQNHELILFGSQETVDLFKKKPFLKKMTILVSDSRNTFAESSLLQFTIHTVKRTLKSILILRKYFYDLRKVNYLYSASDFYPDFLPALILKLKNPKMVWLAGFYLFAPKPWQKNNPYRLGFSTFIKGCLYWLTQQPAYYLINKYADYVFVTSDPDIKPFITKKRSQKKIIVIKGFIDTTKANKYLNSSKVIPVNKRKYDACFMGRFHYQKGVLELIDIWKLVCQKIPEAKLVMIGDGPLYTDVKTKIKKLGLQNNIYLTGFLTGAKKENIFKQSKIMVHPATYDSGGMSMAEGMAYKLPGVVFNLQFMHSYYSRGVLFTPKSNLPRFAKNIFLLLTKHQLYQKKSTEAKIMITKKWSDEKFFSQLEKIVK